MRCGCCGFGCFAVGEGHGWLVFCHFKTGKELENIVVKIDFRALIYCLIFIYRCISILFIVVVSSKWQG
jgi:hypothetical protein